MKILFISNGHGEDAIGARLAVELQRLKPEWRLEALPIVGRGNAYLNAGAKIIGPRWEMPSGGFTFTRLDLFLRDLGSGMLRHTHAMHWAARRARADAVIVVGDVYALWVTFSFARRDVKPPVYQVQPLVSQYYQDGMTARDRLRRVSRVTVDSFTVPERRYMQRVRRVYVRDERSAAWLRELGVAQASFQGNVMMDLLTPEVDLRPLLDGRPVLALLPGTRDDYLYSLPVMLETAWRVPELQTITALPRDASRVRLPAGWHWELPQRLEAWLSATPVAVHESGMRVPILRAAFASLLHCANVVLGTSGTGNEQAVGMGLPVLAFPTPGPQYTPSFAGAQARLLGAGLRLEIPDPSRLALGLRAALNDASWRAQARAAGLERMGSPGGAARIVTDVLEDLQGLGLA